MGTMIRSLLLIAMLPWAVTAQQQGSPIDVLPARATAALAASLKAAGAHANSVWRDTPAMNPDGTVNAYVEIARGDRRKWEFDMRANARRIDRMIPEAVGGYPVNYGIVPQTISYDGDPFDVLVLGPALAGGTVVRGRTVGLMFMEDEKGLDSKVVVSLVGSDGRSLHALTPALQREIGDYFNRYKQHGPGAFSKVPGWGSVAEGLAHVTTTHAFFRECRSRAGKTCRVATAPPR
jgi:inorganic pyrophosphatase